MVTFELALQQVNHRAVVANIHLNLVKHRLEHLNNCAQILSSKALRLLNRE
jgi:hypothetical protein